MVSGDNDQGRLAAIFLHGHDQVIESTPSAGERALAGQTVVAIGATSGIGLETARRAQAEGADLILTARDPDRVQRVGLELGASIAAFDATDTSRLERFFADLPEIDHVLVIGRVPYHDVARVAGTRIRPGGTLIFIGDTGIPTKSLSLELAPVRVNCITARSGDPPEDVAATAVRLMTNQLLVETRMSG